VKKARIQIDQKTIERTARLANLALADKELVKFTRQLKAIVAFVEELDKIDTASVEPTSQVTGLENIWRQDKVEPGLKPVEALRNAPAKQDGRFKVKAILTR